MANYGHYWSTQDTYGSTSSEKEVGATNSGSKKSANTNTAQNVNESDINQTYNTEVKGRQTDTFKK